MAYKSHRRGYLLSGAIAIIVICLTGYLSFKTVGTNQYKPSAPLVLNGINNKIIENVIIKGGTVHCINVLNCNNITIRNCRLISSKGSGINISNSKSITVINCYFANVATGVYAYKSQQISVLKNSFKNMQGPFPRGQMIQFNEVTGNGNRINYNKCQNILGASHPEDALNIYKSHGTMRSPIQIIGNQIRGGGPSKSGGGIMAGDNGGGYIIVKGNILVNPGQYGIAIAGGNHINIIQNTVFGKRQSFTNVGIYVWNQHNSGCASNSISGNKVNWTNAQGESNGSWNNGNCGKVSGWETNTWAAVIDSTILSAKLVE
jgi:nitrous oxidase accessory protein NosD